MNASARIIWKPFAHFICLKIQFENAWCLFCACCAANASIASLWLIIVFHTWWEYLSLCLYRKTVVVLSSSIYRRLTTVWIHANSCSSYILFNAILSHENLDTFNQIKTIIIKVKRVKRCRNELCVLVIKSKSDDMRIYLM